MGLKFFSVSTYWANLEMIEFLAPYFLGNGLRVAKFYVDDSAVGDIAAEPSNSA